MVCYQSVSLSLDGLQVLVVDSDPDSRYLLTMLFEGYGVKTITATSALEALEILKQVKPDLLISEIRLPKEDGYSLMRQVKALEMQKQVPIPAIALTVCAREDDRAHALSVGFEEHLPKPFDIDELLAMVTCLTGHVQSLLTT
jgi:CheY-like chemotaxis protein